MPRQKLKRIRADDAPEASISSTVPTSSALVQTHLAKTQSELAKTQQPRAGKITAILKSSYPNKNCIIPYQNQPKKSHYITKKYVPAVIVTPSLKHPEPEEFQELEVNIKEEFEEPPVIHQNWRKMDMEISVKQEIAESFQQDVVDEASGFFGERLDLNHSITENVDDQLHDFMTSQDVPENFNAYADENQAKMLKLEKLSPIKQFPAATSVKQVARKSTSKPAQKCSNKGLFKVGKKIVNIKDMPFSNGERSIKSGRKTVKFSDNLENIEKDDKRVGRITVNFAKNKTGEDQIEYRKKRRDTLNGIKKPPKAMENIDKNAELPKKINEISDQDDKVNEDDLTFKQEELSSDDSTISVKEVSLSPSPVPKQKKITVPVRKRTLVSCIVGTNTGKRLIKYVHKSPSPIKIKKNPASTDAYANNSNVQLPMPTIISFPKTNKKIVIVKQNPIYRCHKCPLLFTSHNEYTNHLQEHKTKIPYLERKVTKLEELRLMNQFQCSQCPSSFSTIEKLSAHENRHSMEFVCKLCGKKFLMQYRYQNHLEQHKQNKFSCDHCDKWFYKQHRLDEHMDVHFPCDSFQCLNCEEKFTKGSQLNWHQNTVHNKKPPFKCGYCSYETVVKQNFEKHRGMHIRYAAKIMKVFYKCDECPQSFREKDVLEMHKRCIHGRENEGF